MHVRKCGEKGLKFYVPMTSLENKVPGPFNILVHVPGTCALIAKCACNCSIDCLS